MIRAAASSADNAERGAIRFSNVPARNEEHRVLSECIRSILAQDYGSFEVIAVNDRFTDATGTILESLAKVDDNLRVIEGAEPPAGMAR